MFLGKRLKQPTLRNIKLPIKHKEYFFALRSLAKETNSLRKNNAKISRKIQNFLNKFKILAKIHQKRLNFENTRIIFNFQLTLERVKTSDNS